VRITSVTAGRKRRGSFRGPMLRGVNGWSGESPNIADIGLLGPHVFMAEGRVEHRKNPLAEIFWHGRNRIRALHGFALPYI